MKTEQISLQLTAGNNKNSRRELDYYPTPASGTIALMNFLQLPLQRVIYEPACGDGKMSEVIESYGYNVISSDINESCYGMGGVDYLQSSPVKCDAIITNPPFCLSEQFIRKAISESRIVCMLLKSQYWHAAKRYQFFNEFPPTYVLPLTWRLDFLEHERNAGDKKGNPTMEVAWSVWMKGSNSSTQYIPLFKPDSIIKP